MLICSDAERHGSDPVGKVGDVFVSALWTQLKECALEVEEVLSILPAGTMALVDLGCNGGRFQRPEKLVVVWEADVDQTFDVRDRLVRGMEVGILYGVSVDLTNIKIFSDFIHILANDTIGDTPYPVVLA